MAYVCMTGLVALALAGCDGRQPGTAGTKASRAPRHCPSPESESGTHQSTPDPVASIAAPVSFGQPSSTVGAGFDLEFTVHGYKQPAGSACPDPYRPDNEWAAVDVQVCVKSLPDGFTYVVGWAPWSLAYADRTAARISGWTFPDFEQPQYPDGKVMPMGQCARGWITLSAPRDKRPVTVHYQPVGEVHTWTMPPGS
jgi:hypothetical protein